MIGKIYNCPKAVMESGQFIVVGRDSEPRHHATRRPWFLQVREYENGTPTGPWVPVTLKEFKEWNPDAPVTEQSWLSRGNSGGVAELC